MSFEITEGELEAKKSLFDKFLRGTPAIAVGTSSSSTFASEKGIQSSPLFSFSENNEKGKLFLGVVGGSVVKKRLDDDRVERYILGGHPVGIADDRHIITVAGSRSGKGRGALIPNLVSYPGSVLVVDPKGDLAAQTARYRSETLGQKVYVLDPFDVANTDSKFGAAYNPLQTLRLFSPTLVEDAGLIADALVIPGGNDPHWDESARIFIEGCILHVATAPKYEKERNLGTVRDLVMQANDDLELEMLHNPAGQGAVIDSAADFFGREAKERSSVLSTARRHLRFLGYQQIRDVVEDGEIELGTLKHADTPTTIYLSLPAMRMGTCSRWLRLFVNMTLAAMEAEREKPRYPVLMCLDEFPVLGPMKTIEDAAGQIAGLGVKLWPILQDLGQLKALYKDRWETFLGNAGILQFFGNSDLTTLEWISKRLGQATIANMSESSVDRSSQEDRGTQGVSWSYATQEMMTVEEISRFFGRDDALLRQLIIRPSFPPMVLQRAFYDKHELFKGKADERLEF